MLCLTPIKHSLDAKSAVLNFATCCQLVRWIWRIWNQQMGSA